MTTDDLWTEPWWYTLTCAVPGHPGHGRTMIDCERLIRRMELGGGAGQWLLTIRGEHRGQQDRVFPEPV